ncbi:MAG: CocE/NonD family hydrolase [Proteobacteria bacterium]|nr:CocE/NonD family hydrolase [Pseudomonadota bacterium]
MTSAGYEAVLDADVSVPMRDGIRLATDVYRPGRAGKPVEGRFPVILERTPYGKSAASRSERTAADPKPVGRADIAGYFVAHGYVVVYQDCRGRHGSEGAFTKYLDDGPDGYDTVAWLAEQPWCDGRIGTMGLSYAAHTQAALGCLAPPGLAAQVMDSGGFSSAYHGGIRQGGAFELKQATWAFNHALQAPEIVRDPVRRAALEATDLRAWFARMPWRPGHSPLRFAPEYEAYLFEQWTHGDFDEYWKQVGIYMAGYYDQYSDVPVILISSWYDAYTRTATDNFVGLRARKRGPVKLVLGPWTHGDRSVTHAGDVDFGPEATIDGSLAPDWRAFRLRWFDRFLKNESNGAEADPPVRIFVMGGGTGRRNAAGRLDHGGSWRSESDWPLPDTKWTKFHLHGDGGLRIEPQPADAPPLAYDFDPADPVPSIGGTMTSGQPLMEGGAYDQVEHAGIYGCRPPYLPLSSRRDVLVFQTEPLTAPIEVTGPISIRLWIDSDCPDTDFTAKLIDVHPPNPDYPQGYAMNVTDGILRVRYRDSWERPTLMEPRAVYEIVVEPFPTSNLFAAGHCIRLDISSSNFPHFDVNPNSGEPEGRARLHRVARNRIHVDGDRRSHVLLPIVAR